MTLTIHTTYVQKFLKRAFFLTVFCIAPFAYAVDINPNIPGLTAEQSKNPAGIVYGFYQFALTIGGLLAFAAIIYAGVKYTLSAGNPSGKSDAKEGITQALLGLLLLLGAYLILNVINPDLTKLRLPDLNQ